MRTAQEYHESVDSFAREVFDRVQEGDDESDALFEAVDGTDWIIYTAHTVAVLVHTGADDAVFEEMGDDALKGCDSAGAVYQRIAFYAMRQDIAESLEAHREEWEAETAEEDA